MNESQENKIGVAIIGISAGFPESIDHLMYWKNLVEGKEMIKKYTDEELMKIGVPEEKLRNSAYVRSEAVLADKEYFDHSFFEYRPFPSAIFIEIEAAEDSSCSIRR